MATYLVINSYLLNKIIEEAAIQHKLLVSRDNTTFYVVVEDQKDAIAQFAFYADVTRETIKNWLTRKTRVEGHDVKKYLINTYGEKILLVKNDKEKENHKIEILEELNLTWAVKYHKLNKENEYISRLIYIYLSSTFVFFVFSAMLAITKIENRFNACFFVLFLNFLWNTITWLFLFIGPCLAGCIVEKKIKKEENEKK